MHMVLFFQDKYILSFFLASILFFLVPSLSLSPSLFGAKKFVWFYITKEWGQYNGERECEEKSLQHPLFVQIKADEELPNLKKSITEDVIYITHPLLFLHLLSIIFWRLGFDSVKKEKIHTNVHAALVS